jgi:peptide-methionine (S)-S-oxide reductase
VFSREKKHTMRHTIWILTGLLLAADGGACSGERHDGKPHSQHRESMTTATTDTATFGAGCFWCIEAVFQQLDGVITVIPGYTGGTVPHPTYEAVCTGTTGHAEVAQVTFDPKRIGYEKLLEVFWTAHDPTTLNRQGGDVGTQYRSAIFYHNERQKELAEKYRAKLESSRAFDAPIVTEIVPLKAFYVAEGYHQNYYNQNPDKPYCMFVIAPKVEKIRKVFRDQLKPE